MEQKQVAVVLSMAVLEAQVLVVQQLREAAHYLEELAEIQPVE